MRGLRLTLFIIALLSFSSELIRHSYVRWIENHTSVLDKYDAVEKGIKEADSLSALERRYADELAKQRPTVTGQLSDQYNPTSPVFKLRQAITDWERRENEIRELRHYWVGGVVCLLLAIACYRLRLLKMSLAFQIAGFAEMAWWTSPSFAGPTREFTRLLDNEIVVTLLAFGLLLLFWLVGPLRPEAGRERGVS